MNTWVEWLGSDCCCMVCARCESMRRTGLCGDDSSLMFFTCCTMSFECVQPTTRYSVTMPQQYFAFYADDIL
jgi:hypothetical protein